MPAPTLEYYNCQQTIALDESTFGEHLERALPAVLEREPGPGEASLQNLTELELSIVDDGTIADVHGRFMDDPSATDVITFQHGEILVSAETAAREAKDRAWPVERELLLYGIHGLLHLHGYDDLEPENRQRMHRLQEEILNSLWPLPASA